MQRPLLAIVVVVLVLAVSACGGSPSASPAAAAPAVKPVGCEVAAADQLAEVAARIYAQAVSGRNVKDAVRRLQGSRPLAAAVARSDAAATRVALGPILRHLVTRVEVDGPRGRLAAVGSRIAFAPVTRPLRDASGQTVGRVVLSVTDDATYTALVRRLTGVRARIVHRSGGRGKLNRLTHSGPGARRFEIATRSFPSGAARVELTTPPPAKATCGRTDLDTRVGVLGAIAQRLFFAEGHRGGAVRAVRYAEHDHAFVDAVRRGDAAATRAAIVGFFENFNLHVVRVHVVKDGKVLMDLGGPDVLAPAAGMIRAAGGAPVARFVLAVQDDTGYIKLLHRFTGAEVVLQRPEGTVKGSTLDPGSTPIASGQSVDLAGRRFRAASFTATAFPSGPLRISLLVPDPG